MVTKVFSVCMLCKFESLKAFSTVYKEDGESVSLIKLLICIKYNECKMSYAEFSA